MKRSKVAVLAVLLLAACSRDRIEPAPASSAGVPLFEGLGSHHRAVTTSSADAQRYFDQGLAFVYGFKRGFSLFDEDMKSQPPPYFPKDQRPQYLGWELRNLGVRPIQ